MIRRALISVYNKKGILELATELERLGVEIISTGGTYKYLSGNGIDLRKVESITGYPEIFDGRVKTLHPKIFGAILADRSNSSHVDSAAESEIGLIDLVVVNLYPFSETVKREGATLDEAIEQIDIGGVSLIRAAAKNFLHVDVLTSPEQYAEYIERTKARSNEIDRTYARSLASKAFRVTSAYDNLISDYLLGSKTSDLISEGRLYAHGSELSPLRYGENPHQKAMLVKRSFDEIFETLHGKELSYNNLLDISSAYELINDITRFGNACVIVKHGNPCGAAIGKDNTEAYLKAFETDTVSPFGGIIAFNQKLDFNTSAEVDKLFSEIILAPDFESDALELLMKKKNRRLIRFKTVLEKFELRSVSGGLLIQEKDAASPLAENLRFVTKRIADKKVMDDMLFAEMICKHTRSNAIVFVNEMKTLGIGAGQPSRIDSARIAAAKAKQFGHDLSGSSVASDAFFPFADGIREIAASGARSVIQPGGSVRDEEVIAEADANDIAMAFTGIRHFKH